MPHWNEDDYVKRAAAVAQQSAVTKKPLNDVCEKVAQEEALNPEEIRTLVRLSNVAMFQHLFKEKDAAGEPDRHVEFEVGDPEVVIQRLHRAAAEGPQSANIMNDKLSHEIPDMMAAKRRGFELDNSEVKVAQDLQPRPGRPDIALLTMRKLADEYESRRMSAGFRWEEKIAALYDAFNKAPGYGPSFEEFERDAYAELGYKVALEIDSLRDDLRLGPSLLTKDEAVKLAEYRVVEPSKHLELLKEAAAARAYYVAMAEAVEWVKKNMPARVK